jgi:hypothetical protein
VVELQYTDYVTSNHPDGLLRTVQPEQKHIFQKDARLSFITFYFILKIDDATA